MRVSRARQDAGTRNPSIPFLRHNVWTVHLYIWFYSSRTKPHSVSIFVWIEVKSSLKMTQRLQSSDYTSICQYRIAEKTAAEEEEVLYKNDATAAFHFTPLAHLPARHSTAATDEGRKHRETVSESPIASSAPPPRKLDGNGREGGRGGRSAAVERKERKKE